jgi:hypothetical protein
LQTRRWEALVKEGLNTGPRFFPTYFQVREMDNISGGPLREVSMQDVTVARIQSTGVQIPLSPLY